MARLAPLDPPLVLTYGSVSRWVRGRGTPGHLFMGGDVLKKKSVIRFIILTFNWLLQLAKPVGSQVDTGLDTIRA